MTPEEMQTLKEQIESHELLLVRTDLDGPVLAPIAEVERLRAEVEMLRGVGCEEDGDGPCGACIKCRVNAEREACAKLAEILGGRSSFADPEVYESSVRMYGWAGRAIAAAVRARKP